jgi:hypothetical protein
VQEIKKQSIVIASILKPVDDTRMYEKMGKTLMRGGKWEVHIIGYGKSFHSPDLQIHALGEFKRMSLKRLFKSVPVLFLLLKLRPNVLIINTHELLNISFLIRILLPCRIIYDIQENYLLNITHTNAFPVIIRNGIARWVRFKEWISSPIINHYFLAEATYLDELPFVKRKFTVIENKCQLPENFNRHPDKSKIKLLFTDTIDRSTGILECIQLTKSLHSMVDKVELHIVGYCALPDLQKQILLDINNCPYITYQGLTHLVPHTVIMEAIRVATAGIVYYPPSIHNQNRLPTKVYEYLACQLPILLDVTASWKERVIGYQAGVVINFKEPDLHSILNQLSRQTFYPEPVSSAHWSTEEQKLLSTVLDK